MFCYPAILIIFVDSFTTNFLFLVYEIRFFCVPETFDLISYWLEEKNEIFDMLSVLILHCKLNVEIYMLGNFSCI